MIRYASKKLMLGFVSLIVFSFVVFWGVEQLIPGDFFSESRLTMTQQEVDALREIYGVSDPIPVRWWRWVLSFREHGLGSTTFGRGVGTALGERIAPTVFVFVSGLGLAYLVGQWLGRVTGWRSGLRSDALTLGGIAVSTIFPPFLGYLVVQALGTRLSRLRLRMSSDRRGLLWHDVSITEGAVLVRMTVALVVAAIVWSIVSAVIWRLRRRRLPKWTAALGTVLLSAWMIGEMGIGEFALDVFGDALLPMIGFAIIGLGEFMLIMQTGIVGTINEDFVAAARAKGLRERAIRDRHATRNATPALAARLAVSVPYLLTGLVIIEYSVQWEGIGTFLFYSIVNQDIPAAASTLTVIGAITLGTKIFLDLVLYALDPRIARPVRTQA